MVRAVWGPFGNRFRVTSNTANPSKPLNETNGRCDTMKKRESGDSPTSALYPTVIKEQIRKLVIRAVGTLTRLSARRVRATKMIGSCTKV